MTIDGRLAELGIVLPAVVAPVANYVSAIRSGDVLYFSGQLSTGPSGGIKGRVGEDVTLEEGVEAARLCGVNLLAQFRHATDGDLARIKQVLRLGGFVQAGAAFDEISVVMNGCSDLIVGVLGEAGRHARSAVGVYKIPLNCAVEVDAVVELHRR